MTMFGGGLRWLREGGVVFICFHGRAIIAAKNEPTLIPSSLTPVLPYLRRF